MLIHYRYENKLTKIKSLTKTTNSTKHKRIKTYLKFVILLFGISVIVIACQKDDNISNEKLSNEVIKPTFKTFSIENTDEKFNRLKDEVKITKYLKIPEGSMFQGKSAKDTLGLTIATDIIKQVTLGNYTSYTMKIIYENDGSVFYNITIEDKNGEPSIFVTQYTPTSQWLDHQDDNYQGGIKIKHHSFGGGGSSSNLNDLFDNPDLGAGVGGVGDNYSTDYPYDCIGTVIASTQTITHLCQCVTPGHLPGQCTDCSNPGYYEHITVYSCDESFDTGTDPNAGNPNTGGGSNTGIGDGSHSDDSSITVIVGPDEECVLPEEDRPFDENDDCELSPEEACKKNGNRDIICDCVSEGNSISYCQENDDCLELNALSNDSEFMGIMNDLNTKSTTVNKEVGYIQKEDTNTTSGYAYDYVEEEDIYDEINITISSGITLKGFFHTHDDIEKHLPVFSLDDLHSLFALFIPIFQTDNSTCVFNNVFNIEEDFTLILVTAHGTKLALKFDNNGREKLRQFGEKYFGDWNMDTSDMPQIPGITPETDRKIIKKKFNSIVKKKYDIETKKQRLAKFLDKLDFGMSLYQTNDDFTEWEKINKSGDTTPCN